MEWIQVFTIIIAVSSMFMWVRRESNADSKELRGMILSLGNKLESQIDKINENVQKESRDFHGRLCRLEEKYIELRTKKSGD